MNLQVELMKTQAEVADLKKRLDILEELLIAKAPEPEAKPPAKKVA